MGRKMISVEQILASGNKSHLTKKEIEERQSKEEELKKLKKDKIRPPTWLGKRAKKIFRDIVKELNEIDILANIDNYNLAILANAMEKYIECTIELNSDTLTIEHVNKKGFTTVQKNPLITIQLDYASLIRSSSSDFGLTPSARLKIIENNTPIEDEDEKEFKKEFEDV